MRNRNAGFSLRFAAYLIDKILLWLPFLIIGSVVTFQSSSIEELSVKWGGLFIFSLLLNSILWWVYQSLTTAYWGGSFGKKAVGLEVVDEEDRKLLLNKSVFRFIVGYTVSGLVLGLGFLWIVKDDKNRAWHDMLCGTKVIKTDDAGLGIFLLLSLVLLVGIFLAGFIMRVIIFLF